MTEFFYSTLDARRPLDGRETTINGQDAAWAEYSRDENSVIEVVIVKESWAILIVADYPAEKEGEFRPLVEATIQTIKINP